MATTTLVTKLLYSTKLLEPSPCVSKSHAKLERSFELSFGMLISILNVVEIIIIAKIKRKRKIYEILLLSLLVSDCMFGLSNSFVSVLYVTSVCRFESVLETAYTSYLFFVLSSIFHLLLITIDRLVAVLKPVQHKIYLSRRKLYFFIAILWIFAVLVTVLLQIVDEFTDIFKRNRLVTRMLNQTFETTPLSNLRNTSKFALLTASPGNYLVDVIQKEDNFQKHMQFALSITIIVADVTIVLSYSIVIYVTTFKARKMSRIRKRSNKLPVICLAIAGIFVLFTLPYAIVTLAFDDTLFETSIILVLNIGMNSIVYFFRRKISFYYQMNRKKVILNPKLEGKTFSGSTHDPASSRSNDESSAL